MSDVWPPPPQKQPESEATATISNGSIGPVLVASLGLLMLAAAVAAVAVAHLAHFKFSSNTATLLTDAILASIPVIVVGTWAGCYIKETKNGHAAIVVGCAATIMFGLVTLLPFLLRYF